MVLFSAVIGVLSGFIFGMNLPQHWVKAADQQLYTPLSRNVPSDADLEYYLLTFLSGVFYTVKDGINGY